MQSCKADLSVLLVPLLAGAVAVTAAHAKPTVGRLVAAPTSAQTSAPVNGDQADPMRQPLTFDLAGASLGTALQAIARYAGLTLAYNADELPAGTIVTLHASKLPARDALARVLDGTGLEPTMTRSGRVIVARQPERPLGGSEAATARPQQAVVTGIVTDGGTSEPLPGAEVRVDQSDLSALTDAEGRYTLEDVPPGTHTLVASMIGHGERREVVTVTAGATASVDFVLAVSPVPLEEVVATGTAFPAKVRSLPGPINVVTGEDIKAKGATDIHGALLGEIPGVMPLMAGQADFTSQIYVRGNASGGVQDLIKVYIDGVEIAHPTYLSTIDPRSIERIEVVRGPQASVIYGSEASSGVLQIFTKKGHARADRPRVELTASAGIIQSRYTPDDAPVPLTSDYSLEVNGGAESFSYRAGGSYAHTGEWVKNYGSKRLSFSGGLRAVHGPLTAELTALWSDRRLDYAESPIFLQFPPNPSCPQCGNPSFINNYNYALSQNTTGLTLSYEAAASWQHTLTLGDDQNRVAYHQPEPSHNTPADTFVLLQNQEFRRRSVRYNTAYGLRLSSNVTGRFSAGVDYWSYDTQGSGASNLFTAFGAVQPSDNTTVSLINDAWWNAGYYGMAEIALEDRLYLTLAGRVEHNPKFGQEYARAVAPRIGASYIYNVGPAELKLRAQWGKGVRPPPADARTGQDYSVSGQILLPNPAIAPEEKVGWDAGVDVYWGRRASLSTTRFEEQGRNLIQRVPVDLTVTPARYQRQNIGVIGAKGWELEGRFRLSAVDVRANYVYSDNTVEAVSDDVAGNPNATLRVGDRPFNVPKHSGGGRATLRLGRGTVSFDASVMAGWRSIDFTAYYGWLYGGEAYRGSLRDYYVQYPALWRWNLGANQPLTDHLTAVARVDNLAGNQTADTNNWFVSPGRTIVIGLNYIF